MICSADHLIDLTMSAKTRSFFFLPCIILFLAIISSCGSKSKNDVAAKPAGDSYKQMAIQVDGYIVKTQSLGSNVEVPGTLIAKLYDADLQATLKKLQVQLQIAKQNEGRSSELLKIQGISQQDYDASLL